MILEGMSFFETREANYNLHTIFRSGIHYCDSPMNSEIVKVRNGSPFFFYNYAEFDPVDPFWTSRIHK